MSRFCTDQLDWIFWLAVAFLAASLLLGALSAIKALMAKPLEPADPNQPRSRALDGQPIGPILEALKGLIDALGKAPAWFALFLAGLFLFWLAAEAYSDACKVPVSGAAPAQTAQPRSSSPPGQPNGNAQAPANKM
jgi:hypothetical protein